MTALGVERQAASWRSRANKDNQNDPTNPTTNKTNLTRESLRPSLPDEFETRMTTQCVTADHGSEDAPRTCYTMELASDAFRVLTAFCFFALAFGVAGYGFKVRS